MSKRYSNRWSASLGFSYTWLTDFPTDLFRTTRICRASRTARRGSSKPPVPTTPPWGIRHLAGAAASVGRATSRAR